ncbi:MAG TPA: hypothetical protein PLF48_02715 [Chitinophagales bacterium]|nr:hypothetical protein [Chitinophagales bacterium]
MPDDIFDILNNPDSTLPWPNNLNNNFLWGLTKPKNEYISPFVSSPMFKYRKDTNICVSENAPLLSNALGDNKYMYNYFIYNYNDIVDLLETYNSPTGYIGDYEAYFYVERNNPNESNFFGTFVLCNLGKEYKKHIERTIAGISEVNFYDYYHNNKGTLNSFNEVAKFYQLVFNQANNDDIDFDEVSFALGHALNTNIKSDEGIFGIDEKAAGWIKGLAEKIENHKFKEEDYNFEANQQDKDDSEFKEAIEEILDIHKKIIKKIAKIILPSNVQEFLKKDAVKFVEEVVLKALPPKLQLLLQNLIKKAQEVKSIIQQGYELAKDLIAETKKIFTAFLMGVANGFMSLIQMLLEIVAWCVDKVLGFQLGLDTDKAMNGTHYIQARKVMERMEDMYDLISENLGSFIESIKNLFSSLDKKELSRLLDTIKTKLGDTIDKLSKYDIAYFCGNIVFEIIVGVVLALLTGGASVIAQISTRAGKVAQLLKIILQETVSAVTVGASDLFNIFKSLWLKFKEVAGRGFKNFVDYIINILTKGIDDIKVDVTPDDLASVDNFKNVDEDLIKAKLDEITSTRKPTPKERISKKQAEQKARIEKKKKSSFIKRTKEDYLKERKKLIAISKEDGGWSRIFRLYQKSIFKEMTKKELVDFYELMINKFPELERKKINFAAFEIDIYKGGKKIETVVEFAHSGPKKISTDFIDTIPDTEFNKLELIDDNLLTRKNDTEVKFIYNFFENHIHKGDYFVIRSKNIYMACGSCQREFVTLNQLLGNKVKISVIGRTEILNSYDFENFINNK